MIWPAPLIKVNTHPDSWLQNKIKSSQTQSIKAPGEEIFTCTYICITEVFLYKTFYMESAL